MPQPYDYLGAMGGVPNVSAAVQNAVFGEQQRQQNQNTLDQQMRADDAQKALGDLILSGQQPTPSGQQPASAQGQQDPQEAFARLAHANPQAAQQYLRQKRMQQDFGTLMANPNGQSVGRFMMMYPEAADGLKAGWNTLSGAQKDAGIKTSADVHGYLNAGDQEGAIKILQDHIAAAKTTGEDVSAYPDLIDLIRNNPQGAKALSAINLATALGPEKFADNYGKIGDERRADEVQPYKVQQEAADASIKGTEAQYKPSMLQSDLETQASNRERQAAQTANEVARLALDRDHLELDRDTLTSNIQVKLEELDRQGTQLDPGGRQAVNAAVGDSVSATALADRMNDLAGRIGSTKMGSGWVASFRETAKGAFGDQDPISGLRSEYNQIVNAQAVKNLPPGPASDKDIALAKQGFPPSNASPQYLSSFLKGMAKMQQAVAAGADRKANWLSINGSLAPAARDLDVAGVRIPKGTTFVEYNNNAVKRSKQGQMPGSLDGILKKYGGQ